MQCEEILRARIKSVLFEGDIDPTECVGFGWWPILLDLQLMRSERRHNYGINIIVQQIKVKFGGLRYHTNGFTVDPTKLILEDDGSYTWIKNGDTMLITPYKNFSVKSVIDIFNGAISMAERTAARTCQYCGFFSTQRQPPQICTHCSQKNKGVQIQHTMVY